MLGSGDRQQPGWTPCEDTGDWSMLAEEAAGTAHEKTPALAEKSPRGNCLSFFFSPDP